MMRMGEAPGASAAMDVIAPPLPCRDRTHTPRGHGPADEPEDDDHQREDGAGGEVQRQRRAERQQHVERGQHDHDVGDTLRTASASLRGSPRGPPTAPIPG